MLSYGGIPLPATCNKKLYQQATEMQHIRVEMRHDYVNIRDNNMLTCDFNNVAYQHNFVTF